MRGWRLRRTVPGLQDGRPRHVVGLHRHLGGGVPFGGGAGRDGVQRRAFQEGFCNNKFKRIRVLEVLEMLTELLRGSGIPQIIEHVECTMGTATVAYQQKSALSRTLTETKLE